MQAHTYAIMYQLEGTHWWFVGRRRIIASFMKRVVTSLKLASPEILDVGCGTGANLELLSTFGPAQGVDVSPEALAFCRRRGIGDVKEGQAEALPYDDSSFDIVTALDVVEHLDDDVGGLKEMYRVLRPGGRGLFFVPAFNFLWGVQDDVSNHRRRYTLGEVREVVRRSGFEIEHSTYVNITFFFPILIGRILMRLTGYRPASENNLTIGFLNGILGAIFGAEATLLRYLSFPFGVSAICIARRP
jgi:ubiquinone/menaquinone biosynthesis C-methylase UbiE